MRRWWDEWGWVGAIIILSLILLRAFWGREPFCGGVEEQCLREWLGALSGWFAVLAAIATVITIMRQIRDSERHHRDNVLITAYNRLALAETTITKSIHFSHTARFGISHFQRSERGIPASARTLSEMSDYVRRLAEILGRELFQSAEAAFGTPLVGSADVIKLRLLAKAALLDDGSLDLSLIADYRCAAEWVHECSELALEYANESRDLARKFQERISKMTDVEGGKLEI